MLRPTCGNDLGKYFFLVAAQPGRRREPNQINID
jgi:hypothetical protein